MTIKQLDPTNLGIDEDWAGNNAAFRCAHCGKVLIVSGSRIHGGKRDALDAPSQPVTATS